jgi:hypothetical protein
MYNQIVIRFRDNCEHMARNLLCMGRESVADYELGGVEALSVKKGRVRNRSVLTEPH